MFNIKTGNQIISNIDNYNLKARLAAVKALNKTALWLKSQAAKEISREKQIKLNVIRKRLRVFKAKTSRLDVLIRANLYGIRAASIGKMKQTRKGTKVGKHQFTGAFMAVMPRGSRGVYKRKGRTALPIEEVKLPLEPEASRIIESLVNYEVERIFEEYFSRELNYIMKI
ncbi:MAG: phage tail protein [Wolbachia endosymbiont of Tyrophagus putrescentiae]|nr:phage tail protein [Wolbachia endosymbiont of Tyrophagus putrescentiae]